MNGQIESDINKILDSGNFTLKKINSKDLLSKLPERRLGKYGKRSVCGYLLTQLPETIAYIIEDIHTVRTSFFDSGAPFRRYYIYIPNSNEPLNKIYPRTFFKTVACAKKKLSETRKLHIFPLCKYK